MKSLNGDIFEGGNKSEQVKRRKLGREEGIRGTSKMIFYKEEITNLLSPFFYI